MEGGMRQGQYNRIIHSKDQEIIRTFHPQQSVFLKWLPRHKTAPNLYLTAEFSVVWELGSAAPKTTGNYSNFIIWGGGVLLDEIIPLNF
jgi:hypothetical protein